MILGMGRIQFAHGYDDIISIENLLEAWREFREGKQKRADVQEFGRNLMYQLQKLHTELASGAYKHSLYEAFNIADPKPRDIHKAVVRDRLLHHALCRKLQPFFDRTFIPDSYSCRVGKGVHKAFRRFAASARKVSRNHTKTVWVLKCDIRKFFASVDQGVLLSIVERYVSDKRIVALIAEVVHSFGVGVGLPLGNLTSQLLVNVYMNEFDRFVKHQLKAKHYIRYADDFVFLSQSKSELEGWLLFIRGFLGDRLKLSLHPDKVFIKTFASGIDFLGWVHFPDHRVLRTTTKRRMLRCLGGTPSEESVASYLGLLKHGNARKLQKEIDDRSHDPTPPARNAV